MKELPGWSPPAQRSAMVIMPLMMGAGTSLPFEAATQPLKRHNYCQVLLCGVALPGAARRGRASDGAWRTEGSPCGAG